MKTLIICLILIFGGIATANAVVNIAPKDTVIITDKQQKIIKKEAANDAILYYKDHSQVVRSLFQLRTTCGNGSIFAIATFIFSFFH